jgi:hypothetical protein
VSISPTVGMTTAAVASSFTQCAMKDGFDTEGVAHFAMMTAMRFTSAADRARLNVYLCPHCFSYHIGKSRRPL